MEKSVITRQNEKQLKNFYKDLNVTWVIYYDIVMTNNYLLPFNEVFESMFCAIDAYNRYISNRYVKNVRFVPRVRGLIKWK
jgi:hypothetical protein